MKIRLSLLSVFLLFLLVSCNDEPEQGQRGDESPFQNISTETPADEQPSEIPNNGLNTNEDQLADNEEINRDQEDLQKALPEDSITPEELYEEEQYEAKQVEVITTLPFDSFKERWNAISDAQLTNLYISKFQEMQNDVGISYTASLNAHMKLRVKVTSDYVQSVGLVSDRNVDTVQMLTGWSQVIKILHPELEIHDVDAFFNEIGVGPNGDLTNLKEGIYPYDYLEYELAKTEEGYVFRGAYK
ncbi:hypothetical protein [Ornithinibacillus xuwenensis]|uniref:Lipoprotein n=1 Tax=Ornithinibacillus xuwenensis TaxID=3144668 RepID=A0ABU9XGG4_9BACI